MVTNKHIVFLHIILLKLVTCQEWQHISTKRDVMFKIINTDFNRINASVELYATSLLQCTYKCQRRSSVAFYYVEVDGRCFCNDTTDSNEGGGDSTVIYGVFRSEKKFKYQNIKKWLIVPEGYDCHHYYLSGYGEDGIYPINPKGTSSFEVWCDMSNGGWTVFQNRFDGSISFDRNWDYYRDGFGEMTGEFWLGLDYLHSLADSPCEVWMEMTAPDGNTPKYAYLKLYNLTVGGPETNYTLLYQSATNNCSLFWDYTHKMNATHFSTPWRSDCAYTYKSGWWFRDCHQINLNGVYGLNEFGQGLSFSPCWGHYMSLAKSTIKLQKQIIFGTVQ